MSAICAVSSVLMYKICFLFCLSDDIIAYYMTIQGAVYTVLNTCEVIS